MYRNLVIVFREHLKNFLNFCISEKIEIAIKNFQNFAIVQNSPPPPKKGCFEVREFTNN